MTITRLDLDGLGSPAAIAGRILEVENDLPLAIPLERLCSQLDISSVERIDTEAFEAALVMDANKAEGAIMLARHRPPQRARYSLAHELGHWLIPPIGPTQAVALNANLMTSTMSMRRSGTGAGASKPRPTGLRPLC